MWAYFLAGGDVRDNMRESTWEFIILLVVTLGGWAFTAGSMYAHLSETEDRLQHLETKVDLILMHEKGLDK